MSLVLRVYGDGDVVVADPGKAVSLALKEEDQRFARFNIVQAVAGRCLGVAGKVVGLYDCLVLALPAVGLAGCCSKQQEDEHQCVNLFDYH
jgi:hypothetical protein